MPTFRKGHFCIDLSFRPAEGEVAAEDRQCAWEIYVEMISRTAVCGATTTKGENIFGGEILSESFDSLYRFAEDARAILRRYPVGRVEPDRRDHLGFFLARLLEIVIGRFLNKWRGRYCLWWKHATTQQQDPFECQKTYPHLEQLIEEWVELRRCCGEVAVGIESAYRFPPLLDAIPVHVRDEWEDEARKL
jgi:hypothetical protein